jgi:signal transduction histidine kinase
MKPLSFRAHQKALHFITEIQPNVPKALLGDPGRIRRVLINLVEIPSVHRSGRNPHYRQRPVE